MEKFEPIKWGSEDQTGSGQARSYSCTFCKRGFSNAQALGGHMNIHRRDRARIRQIFSEENQVNSSETNTSVPKNPPSDHNHNNNNNNSNDINIQYPININALSSEDQKSSDQKQGISGELVNKNPYVNCLMMRSDDNHYPHHEHDHGDEQDYHQHSMAAGEASGKVVIGGAEEADHRQIPFFVKESVAGDHGVPASLEEEEERIEELDLELRLGPERQDTATLSTREFF